MKKSEKERKKRKKEKKKKKKSGPFQLLIEHRKLDSHADDRVRLQKAQDLGVVPPDIPFQFLSAHWEILEQVRDAYRGTLRRRDHGLRLELARALELQLHPPRCLLGQRRDDVEVRQRTQRRQRFAAEAKSRHRFEVGVSSQLRRVVLQGWPIHFPSEQPDLWYDALGGWRGREGGTTNALVVVR